MWHCGWGFLILSHHPAKFGIYRPWKSGDITSLICHVTTWLMYRVTLWVGFFLPNSPRCNVWVHRPCEKGIITFFCLSCDHGIKVSCDFVGEVLSSYVTTLLRLGSISLMELEIMSFVISIPIPIPIPVPRFQCRGLQMAVFIHIVMVVKYP